VDDTYYGDLCDLELADDPPVRWGNGYTYTKAQQLLNSPTPTCTPFKTRESPLISQLSVISLAF
jgi:hypothetical protein